MAKTSRKTLWARADEFAEKHYENAFKAIESGAEYALHEYLRFAFMNGYGTRARDEKRQKSKG